jgi:hypothetical protein
MHKDQHIPRIPPLKPPYSSEVAAALAKWMPPGAAVEPLKLFRTLFQNREMSDRMRPLGAGILGSHSSIDARDREIVIDRVCARCGCEYEWGVHVVSFGQAVGLSQETLEATVTKTRLIPPGRSANHCSSRWWMNCTPSRLSVMPCGISLPRAGRPRN